MRHERPAPSSSGKSLKYHLIVCATLILCFSQAAQAQSGRRQSKDVAPPPPVKTDPALEPQSTARISSIIIGGDIVHNVSYYRSNDLDKAVKACMERLKETSPVLTVTKGGKMDLNEAKERAKKETDAYVLWIELGIKADGLSESFICFIDYAVLMPQTAKFLTSGRVFPGDSAIASSAVLRIPSLPRRMDKLEQLELGGQAVADRVRAKL